MNIFFIVVIFFIALKDTTKQWHTSVSGAISKNASLDYIVWRAPIIDICIVEINEYISVTTFLLDAPITFLSDRSFVSI